jgi:hypothetical protein
MLPLDFVKIVGSWKLEGALLLLLCNTVLAGKFAKIPPKCHEYSMERVLGLVPVEYASQKLP